MTTIIIVAVLALLIIGSIAGISTSVGRSHAARTPYSISRPKGNNSILFVDTETTGLPAKKYSSYKDTENWPRLVQISWILTSADGTILHSTEYIIRPEHFTIPQESTKIHGITNSLAKTEGYKLSKVLKQFLEISEQADIIVGHNIDFDINVIAAELYRKNMPIDFIHKPRACTMKASREICAPSNGKNYKYPKLNELYRHLFGENFDGAHNAQTDVYATMQCYFAILDLYNQQSPILFKVELITDRMETISIEVQANNPTEAKDVAIKMLECGELECVGRMCASCDVKIL